MTVWFEREGAEYTGKITVINATSAYFLRQNSCYRCGGAGGSDKWAHTGWTCYDCGGSGKGAIVRVKLYTAEKLDKLNATRNKARAKKEAARIVAAAKRTADRQAAFDLWISKHDQLETYARDALPRLTDSEFAFVHGVFLTQIDCRFAPTTAMTERMIEIVARANKRFKEAQNSQYLGKVGERVTFTGVAKELYYRPAISWQESAFFIYSFKGDGFTAIYKGSKTFRSGEEYTIKATIKELTTYKDTKQTVVARPKIL